MPSSISGGKGRGGTEKVETRRRGCNRAVGVTGKRENREIGVRNERYKAGSRIVVPNWVKSVSRDVSVSGCWP